jgi:hypothetical protein
MTCREFRKVALRFPGTSESAHMEHPDFRVGGRIFATLDYPEEGGAMVKLLPEQQRQFMKIEPGGFHSRQGRAGTPRLHERSPQGCYLSQSQISPRRGLEERDE